MSDPSFALYQRLPGLVLGFHGCDALVGEGLLNGEITHLAASKNKYDWLGNGIYFWENDPLRALEFAKEAHAKAPNAKGYVGNPFVIGAVIDLGFCLNLLDRTALAELAEAHKTLEAAAESSKEEMPVNKGKNFGARFLDRAVIELLHAYRAQLNQVGADFAPYESVRGAFFEGGDLYTGAGFQAKSHIQIAVRENSCIKGYFRPITT